MTFVYIIQFIPWQSLYKKIVKVIDLLCFFRKKELQQRDGHTKLFEIFKKIFFHIGHLVHIELPYYTEFV